MPPTRYPLYPFPAGLLHFTAIRVDHTFGSFSRLAVPGGILPFYVYVAEAKKSTLIHGTYLTPPATTRLCSVWPLRRRKFKMFTYLTNIHYHATYSQRGCCCCCTSIFVIYSWWYCRKSSSPHPVPYRAPSTYSSPPGLARNAFFPIPFWPSRTARSARTPCLPHFAESALNPWLLLNSEAQASQACVPWPCCCCFCLSTFASPSSRDDSQQALSFDTACPPTRRTAYVATWATLDERPPWWVASSRRIPTLF